jgi:ryanodine receptor 2
MRLKLEAGWTYGETKDPVLKKHPALVPWEKLPPETKAKDAVFTAIVKALAK